MAEYLVLAETVLFKNNRLTVINTYSELTAIAMPAEFRFDMAIMCGPKWSVGEHELTVKVKANDSKEEMELAKSKIEIPNENFVYNAIASDIKFTMNYDIQYLTFTVQDNGKDVLSRVYPVRAMLVPQTTAENNDKTEPQEKNEEIEEKDTKKNKK